MFLSLNQNHVGVKSVLGEIALGEIALGETMLGEIVLGEDLLYFHFRSQITAT